MHVFVIITAHFLLYFPGQLAFLHLTLPILDGKLNTIKNFLLPLVMPACKLCDRRCLIVMVNKSCVFI